MYSTSIVNREASFNARFGVYAVQPMKGITPINTTNFILKASICFGLILAGVLSAYAQMATTTDAETSADTAEPTVDPMRARLTHARVLAAAGNFTLAASELEAIRAEAKDETVRDVTRLLLMSVHLSLSHYTRAREMLEEAFKARAEAKSSTTNIYYALTGQMLNSFRSRIDRYREFGLDIADGGLPTEARSDLDQMRTLVERLAEQAKAIREENARHADSSALLEDAASVRLRLARNSGERVQWQREISEARQHLAASQTRADRHGSTLESAPATTIIDISTATVATAPADSNTNTGAASTPAPESVPAQTAPAQSAPAQTAPGQPNTRIQSAPPASGPAATEKTSDDSTAAAKSGRRTSDSSASPPRQTAPTSEAQADNSRKDQSPSELISVGSLADKAMQKVAPNYPSTAKSARIGGVVTVYLVVNEKGVVEDVRATSGPAMLKQAANEAARRWRFSPTLLNGQPVRVAGYISFNFTL